MDIIMTGYAGQKETADLAVRYEARLRRELPLSVTEAARVVPSEA